MKFMKLGSKPDSFQTDGNDVRFVATELATDIIVDVGGIKFYLHKFPLLSKSAHLQKLVAIANEANEDEIHIPDIPGGPSAFENCAKFCYGMTVTLNPYNVVAARCASEYLEMHETIEKGNLIYKIDVFLSSSIFRSWKDSIIVLQTTKSLLSWAEDLKMVNQCIECIAAKACIDTSRVDWSYTYNRKKLPSEHGLDSNWNGVKKQHIVPMDWWVEDLCDLDIDFYKRVLASIKAKGRISPRVLGEALKAYAHRRIPGITKAIVVSGCDAVKYRSLLETITWLLPSEIDSVSCSFLLRLLRGACMLDCSEICKKELVNRIGWQLEEASVHDLLIPTSSSEITVYDVDIVLSIVEQFVMQENGNAKANSLIADEVEEVKSPCFVSDSSRIAVAKLIDGYLAEIAKDPHLSLSKFIDLAQMVSSISRPVHDGLYRAIDMYLKEHSDLSKSEKKKLCSLMDCRRLSADACVHAVQNERLPLRVVVQILFFEQVRAAASGVGVGSELSANIQTLLPRQNGGSNSNGSSRSAGTTNTDDDWDGARTVDDLKSLKSMGLIGGSERSSANADAAKNSDGKSHSKVKGILMPKKILGKIWSHKGESRENSSSDTSESPNSTNMEETKSTTSRKTRHSVS